MGYEEAMRDAYYALFGFVMLLYSGIGFIGIVELQRLRVGKPALGRRLYSRGEDVLAALGPGATTTWRRAAAWSDVCAGVAGVAAAAISNTCGDCPANFEHMVHCKCSWRRTHVRRIRPLSRRFGPGPLRRDYVDDSASGDSPK